MDITYRRHPPDSRLEQLLVWLVPAKPAQVSVARRIDFAPSEILEVELA